MHIKNKEIIREAIAKLKKVNATDPMTIAEVQQIVGMLSQAVCEMTDNYSLMTEDGLMPTRKQFMEFFRDEDSLNTLSPDDRIEIFETVLLGSGDITKDRLTRLISDYNVGNLEVTEVTHA